MNSSKWIFYWFLTVYCLTLQGCANVPYCKDGCPDPKNINPIETYGPHGGFFDWKDHLFPLDALDNRLKIPLPILGSVLALVRTWYSPSAQDLSNNTYSEMRSKILEVLESGKPLLYLGAHDHGLQVFKGAPGAEYHVVSGGGSENKITSVGHNEFTQFAHAHTGFMMIDFLTNKCVNLSVIEPDEQKNSGQVVFSKILACKSGMHKPD